MAASRTAPQLLTDEEVADRLRVSKRFVQQLRLAREIPFVWLDPANERQPRIAEPDLAAYLERLRRAAA